MNVCLDYGSMFSVDANLAVQVRQRDRTSNGKAVCYVELPTSNQFRHCFMLSRRHTRTFDIVCPDPRRDAGTK
jgi:hypothetical protein